MGRVLRPSAGGVVYHVLNRRVRRLPLFADDGDGLAFVRVLKEGLCRCADGGDWRTRRGDCGIDAGSIVRNPLDGYTSARCR